MLTISSYKKKLFFIIAVSMMLIVFIVMVLGYIASKKSTVATMKQSANIEIKLKKEILLQVVEQTKKTIATFKEYDLSDNLFYSQEISSDNHQLLEHMFKVNIDLLGFRCLDENGNVLCRYFKDRNGETIKVLNSNENGKYHVGKNLFHESKEAFIVDLHVVGTQTVLSMGTYVDSNESSKKNTIIIDVDISHWIGLYLESELFEIAILNKQKNILRSSSGIAQNPTRFLRMIEDEDSSQENWHDGYMYKSQNFLDTAYTSLDVYFQSKANLNEITRGMVWIFLVIFALIVPVSLFISYLLSRAHGRLIQKIISREDMIAQESKMIELGGMMSYLAHQWRQPINAISTGLMLLYQNMEDKNESELCQKLEEIEVLVQGFSSDIETFRNFYRFSKIKESFGICDALRDIVKIISPQLKTYRVNIVSPKEDAELFGYKNEWKHALMSIINNIIEAYANLPELTQRDICFMVKKEGNSVTLFIEDKAGGIDAEIKNKLFNKYSTTKSSNFGTGLGLYFAKIIIEERFGGKLSFETSDTGTIFIIKNLYSDSLRDR